ncbi:MAG TPA: exodeoxyribonuclease VII large subunit [Acidimicrobiales bacterium]|nr:exodeoxyribonuclease VII large subunit [Acidimicrobiales bacterium]
MTTPLFSAEPTRAPRTVSLIRLAGEIARTAASIGRVAVQGEVHRPTRTGGGRIYFTLRDRAAQITVMCPQAKVSRCRTVAGERVLVIGSLTWVNERGQLLLVAEEVTPVGGGAVAAMIAEARRRLEADGLLDRARRPIPRLPDLIGVVCGSDAAVRKDIESVVSARFPGYPVRFSETNLSGPGAALSIIDALQGLAGDPQVGVIILARGGGDATQLLPFSDEELCRAIADCPVPVVSAIGHEGDRPLCDEVADLRCGTPSLAAAAVVPVRDVLAVELAGLQAAARAAVGLRLEGGATRLAAIDTQESTRAGAALAASRLSRVEDQVRLLHPRRQLAECARQLTAVDWHGPPPRRWERAAGRLATVDWRRPGVDQLRRSGDRLAADAKHLFALSPARVLERGYAVVRVAGGPVVRRADQVVAGQPVEVQLAAGRLAARVEEVLDG